ncbi:hypothetical protein [Amycolatopsis sp. NPDC059657]|uniref:hypothetical protein n=1 Tax=Amycolatopsis sp. NPDC059657 TaxID=3346899 RepID=UPI00366FE52B
MAYASGILARTPYAAGTGTEAPPPSGQQTLPPPIPGGTSTWVYTPNPLLSYAARGYAGRISTATYPGGGISIAPLPDRGVMHITAWWPDARLLSLQRIHSDGTVHSVRGGGALVVTEETRRNFCLNPSFEVGLNGYVPDLGSPTLARVTDGTSPRGSYHMTATVAGAGSCGITIPQSIPGGQNTRFALDLKFSARPTSVTLQIGWADYQGIALPAATVTLTADQINQSVSQWARQSAIIVNPAGGVTPTVKVIAAGMPAGGVMSVDGIVLARVTDPGTFFDGTTYGGVWIGTAGLSASLIPPIITFDDGECPLDQPVTYRLTNPAPAGGSMTSALAELSAAGHTWLTHPRDAANPREVFVERGKSPLKRAARQGLFQAIGDDLVSVVSARKRTGPSGTLKLWTFSYRDRDDLLDLLDDMAPLLLRAPLEVGFGAVSWISLGDLDEDPDGAGDDQGYQKLVGDFVSTRAPIG